MKLKNVELGMKVVVKKKNDYFSKGEIAEVIVTDLDDEVYDVRILGNVGNICWVNHKDIKKLKGV